MKISKIVKCILNINYFGTYLKGVSPLFELNSLLKIIKKANTLIDIGSNKGQFILLFRKFFPSAMVYSFEPLRKELFLQKKILGIKNIKYFNFAIGNKNKNIKMYITSRRDSSSLLKPNITLQKNYSINNTKLIKQKKLDSLINFKHLKKPILLKIDVQGYELQALMGASDILKNVDYLILEVSHTMAYYKQSSLKDLKFFLYKYSFFPKKKTNKSYLNGKLFQEDVLFVKNLSQ